MPSFDVVSRVDSNEVDNALNQTVKEVGTRYDFKDTGTSVERNADGVVFASNSEGRLEAALDVFKGKCVRRGVSLKHVDPQKPTPGPKGSFRQLVKIKQGIDRDNARKIVEMVKEAKLKVTAAIQEDLVRVTGKNRDDLQETIRILRAAEFPFEIQCLNFRE